MRLFFYLFVFLYLLLMYSCEIMTERTSKAAHETLPAYIKADSSISAKTDSSLALKAFIRECSLLEIIPVDESVTDTSLLRFITHLKHVVSEKNTAALLDLIGPATVTSHGGGLAGKKEFIEHWQLQKQPQESEVWQKFERALALGGCFNKESEKPEFILPYLQSSHYFDAACDFDWFITYVCISPLTKIYEKPDKASKVIAGLNYRILESSYDAKISNSFIPVHTFDQSIKGYVQEQDVYPCADYMLVIGKEHGTWEIKAFSPFD